jgi:hypothetical protein
MRNARNAKPNSPEASKLKPWRLNMSFYLTIVILMVSWLTLIMGGASFHVIRSANKKNTPACTEEPSEFQKNYAKFSCQCNPKFDEPKCPKKGETKASTSCSSSARSNSSKGSRLLISSRSRLLNNGTNATNTNSSSQLNSECKVFNAKFKTCEAGKDPACNDCGHCHHTSHTYFMMMMAGLCVDVILGLALYVVSWQCSTKKEKLTLEVSLENPNKANVWLTFCAPGAFGTGNRSVMLTLKDANTIRKKFFELQTQLVRRARVRFDGQEAKDLFLEE